MNADYDYLYDPYTRSLWDRRTDDHEPEPFDVEGDTAGACYDVAPTALRERTQGDGWTEVVECDEPRTYADTNCGENT